MWEQNSYPLWFSSRRNSYPEQYEHLNPICDSPLQTTSQKSRQVTEQFLCENRIPIRYGFRAGTKDSYPEQYEHLNPICYSPLETTSQKSRQINRSNVWTEALVSGMVFVPAQ